jgi:ribosomal protein L35AE/L33A
LFLKEYADGKIVYEYQPEGKGEVGEVLFDTHSMSGELVRRAEEDTDGKTYGFKALFKVEELVKNNNIPLKCTQAWY